jgi:hypothetical protein
MSKTVIGSLSDIANRLSGLGAGVPEEARSDEREEVIVRYIIGTGEISKDGKYIILKAKMYKLNGELDGHHEGVFEALYDLNDPNTINELMHFPDPPIPPLDQPSPVIPIPVRANTKAIWTFRDNSSIEAVGPALVQLAAFKDGSKMLFGSAAARVPGGTGRYQGVVGINSAIGSTFLKKGAAFGPGTSFPGKAIESFRVIWKKDLV